MFSRKISIAADRSQDAHHGLGHCCGVKYAGEAIIAAPSPTRCSFISAQQWLTRNILPANISMLFSCSKNTALTPHYWLISIIVEASASLLTEEPGGPQWTWVLLRCQRRSRSRHYRRHHQPAVRVSQVGNGWAGTYCPRISLCCSAVGGTPHSLHASSAPVLRHHSQPAGLCTQKRWPFQSRCERWRCRWWSGQWSPVRHLRNKPYNIGDKHRGVFVSFVLGKHIWKCLLKCILLLHEEVNSS